MGIFAISAYGADCIGCTGRTYSGTIPQLNQTIAVDPNVIPLGSKVLINGVEYIAEDIGGAIKGNRIDMFVGTEANSVVWGIQEHEVFILEE